MAGVKDTILEHFEAADKMLVPKRKLWTEYEDLLHGQLSDSISNSSKVKSQIVDPKLATFVMDRSARVMAQLPTGKVRAISKNDEGSSRLMNLILDKYVIPNANAQFDFLTKCRMVDLYSNIYGNFFVMTDWDVRKNGYVGPDFWMIPIRDVFPQVGAMSVDDSDRIVIRTWRNLSFFEGLNKKGGYQNLDSIIETLKKQSGSKHSRSSEEMSSREIHATPQGSEPAKGSGFFEVLSMYEGDRWVDYVKDADKVLRDRENPNKDGELPVANKYSIPLIDDQFAMGDFERGKPMQYTLNSLWNLYMDGVKVSIFPPVLINKDNVADSSSIKWTAAAKWMMKNNLGNSAQALNLSPQGTNTFNNVYQTVTASLLNMMGTSDTAVSQNVDPGFGKTPQALQMQAQRENARDNVDRFYMEQFLTKVNRKFANMVSKRMEKSVKIRLFEDEIKELERSYPEIKEMYDEKSGKVSIGKDKTGSCLYDYEIVSGSTYAVDQKQQQQNLLQLLNTVMQTLQLGQQGELVSPILTALEKEGKELKVGELFSRVVANSGIQDWDKIIVERTDEEQSDSVLGGHQQQLEQAIQSIMGNVNGVPPQPQGMPQDPMAGQQMPPMPQEQMMGVQNNGQFNPEA